MHRPPLSKCRCGKLACPSLDAAREIRAKIWAERGGEPEVRYYTCPHGPVHWTRMTEPI